MTKGMNAGDPIGANYVALHRALDAAGWDVAPMEALGGAWWAVALWELTSRWSPVGATAIVVFLVDPQAYRADRNPGRTDVWAVSVTKDTPVDRTTAEAGAIARPLSPEARRRIVEAASALRGP